MNYRGIPAAEKYAEGPRPRCECHGEPQYWYKDWRRRAGGYWRCGVKQRATQKARNATTERRAYMKARDATPERKAGKKAHRDALMAAGLCDSGCGKAVADGGRLCSAHYLEGRRVGRVSYDSKMVLVADAAFAKMFPNGLRINPQGDSP